MLVFYSWLQTEENFDPSFIFDYRGPIQMKGKAEPMSVYFLRRNADSPNIESLSTVTMASGGGVKFDLDPNTENEMDMTVTSGETGRVDHI